MEFFKKYILMFNIITCKESTSNISSIYKFIFIMTGFPSAIFQC